MVKVIAIIVIGGIVCGSVDAWLNINIRPTWKNVIHMICYMLYGYAVLSCNKGW